jgi:hypothetical protein
MCTAPGTSSKARYTHSKQKPTATAACACWYRTMLCWCLNMSVSASSSNLATNGIKILRRTSNKLFGRRYVARFRGNQMNIWVTWDSTTGYQQLMTLECMLLFTLCVKEHCLLSQDALILLKDDLFGASDVFSVRFKRKKKLIWVRL